MALRFDGNEIFDFEVAEVAEVAEVTDVADVVAGDFTVQRNLVRVGFLMRLVKLLLRNGNAMRGLAYCVGAGSIWLATGQSAQIDLGWIIWTLSPVSSFQGENFGLRIAKPGRVGGVSCRHVMVGADLTMDRRARSRSVGWAS